MMFGAVRRCSPTSGRTVKRKWRKQKHPIFSRIPIATETAAKLQTQDYVEFTVSDHLLSPRRVPAARRIRTWRFQNWKHLRRASKSPSPRYNLFAIDPVTIQYIYMYNILGNLNTAWRAMGKALLGGQMIRSSVQYSKQLASTCASNPGIGRWRFK